MSINKIKYNTLYNQLAESIDFENSSPITLKLNQDVRFKVKDLDVGVKVEQFSHGSEIMFQREMTNIMLFINHFPSTERILYEYIYLYIKKYKQCELTLAQLCLKKIQPNYADKLLNEPVSTYIKWLLL